MNAYQKARNYLSNTARGLAVAGAITLGAITGSGCTTAPTPKGTYEQTVSSARESYSQLREDDKLRNIESRINSALADGVVNPASKAYETPNELADVFQAREDAKTLAESYTAEDSVTQAHKTMAENLQKKAEEIINAYKTNGQADVYLMFVLAEGKNATWKGNRPGDHYKLNVTKLDDLAAALEIPADQLIERMQYVALDQFGFTAGRGLSQQDYDGFKDHANRWFNRVPKDKLNALAAFFPEGGITNSEGTIRAAEYAVLPVHAAYIVAVPKVQTPTESGAAPSEGTTPPVEGTTPPVEGTTPPTEGSSTPPTEGSATPPTEGSSTPPTETPRVPPIDDHD